MTDWIAQHRDLFLMALEIAIIFVILYAITRFFRGTRGAGILRGYMILLIAVYTGAFWLAREFELTVISWVIDKSLTFAFIVLIVVLQPELRQAMIRLGLAPLKALSLTEAVSLDALARAVQDLAQRRIGALIAVERRIGLKEVIGSGTPLDAAVSPALLRSIFTPGSPLHDGAVVIREDRVAAAGCLFPLADKGKVGGKLGTRHLAALGVSQDSDAVVIVVSEETGAISLAARGELAEVPRAESLPARLREMYMG